MDDWCGPWCAQRPKPTGLLSGTQNPSIKHGGNIGNHFGILLPVCCRHAGIWLWTIGAAMASCFLSGKHVPDTRNHSQMLSPAYESIENKLCPVIPKVALFPVSTQPLDSVWNRLQVSPFGIDLKSARKFRPFCSRTHHFWEKGQKPPNAFQMGKFGPKIMPPAHPVTPGWKFYVPCTGTHGHTQNRIGQKFPIQSMWPVEESKKIDDNKQTKTKKMLNKRSPPAQGAWPSKIWVCPSDALGGNSVSNSQRNFCPTKFLSRKA